MFKYFVPYMQINILTIVISFKFVTEKLFFVKPK